MNVISHPHPAGAKRSDAGTLDWSQRVPAGCVCLSTGQAEEAAAVVEQFTTLNEPVKLCNKARQLQMFANEMIIKE